MVSHPDQLADNQIYYFKVGQGVWRGRFSFRIIDRDRLRADPIGIKYRLLARGMSGIQKLFGDSRLDSEIWASPDDGEFGVARNRVRISRFLITLYLLNEQYLLNVDGTRVVVQARERFGPIPFLFRTTKQHPAVIHKDGLSSTYYMPLLGAEWTADYEVRPDRGEIAGRLVCPWAECTETMSKQSSV